MLNYLARLGWSHGDEELFTREQMVAWFDGGHLAKSPAQWDAAKLDWVNAHYLKALDDAALAALVAAQLARRGIVGRRRRACCAHVRPLQGPLQHRRRAGRLARACLRRRRRRAPPTVALHVTDAVRPALRDACATSSATVDWNKAAIAAAIKETLAAHGLKMPQLAPAVRVLVCGRAQTPSLDAVLELFDRATVLARLACGRPRPNERAGYNLGFGGGDRPVRQARSAACRSSFDGGIAQLGERLHGMQEVSGSIPLTSTRWVEAGLHEAGIESLQSPSSRGLGHHPFTVITGVRIP